MSSSSYIASREGDGRKTTGEVSDAGRALVKRGQRWNIAVFSCWVVELWPDVTLKGWTRTFKEETHARSTLSCGLDV